MLNSYKQFEYGFVQLEYGFVQLTPYTDKSLLKRKNVWQHSGFHIADKNGGLIALCRVIADRGRGQEIQAF